MGNNSDRHKLLAVVPAVHHERICETFDDGTLGLSEAFNGISAGGVGDVDGLADLDIIAVLQSLRSAWAFSGLCAFPSPCPLDHKLFQYESGMLTLKICRGLRRPRKTIC